MAIEFLKKPRMKMVSSLASTIRAATTGFGRFHGWSVQSFAAGDEICAGTSWKKSLPHWLSTRTINYFLTDEINATLRLAKRPHGARCPLTAWSPFADPEAAAEMLLQRIETLPWSYELVAPTTISEEPKDYRIELHGGFELSAFSETTAASYPVAEVDLDDAEMHRRSYPDKMGAGQYYFLGRHEGYIRQNGPTAEVSAFMDAMIAFLGLLVCDGDLMVFPFTYGGPSPAVPVLVYRVDGDRELLPYRWLSVEHSALLQEVKPTAKLDGANLLDQIGGIKAAFMHMPTRSAARWYLDSHFGSNGLMQVVQATIALEILLGDRNESRQTGLSSLLANRLAYLIGTSPKNRERIIERFRELYELRSSIVHAGAAVLADTELKALEALQRYAQQAIQVHISELRA